jgi:hypothetical protein
MPSFTHEGRRLASMVRRRAAGDPELPNARLLRAESFLELRLTPERLTDEISGFLDECWAPRAADVAPRSANVA